MQLSTGSTYTPLALIFTIIVAVVGAFSSVEARPSFDDWSFPPTTDDALTVTDYEAPQFTDVMAADDNSVVSMSKRQDYFDYADAGDRPRIMCGQALIRNLKQQCGQRGTFSPYQKRAAHQLKRLSQSVSSKSHRPTPPTSLIAHKSSLAPLTAYVKQMACLERARERVNWQEK